MDHQEKVLHFMRHGSSRRSRHASNVLSISMAGVMAAHGETSFMRLKSMEHEASSFSHTLLIMQVRPR